MTNHHTTEDWEKRFDEEYDRYKSAGTPLTKKEYLKSFIKDNFIPKADLLDMVGEDVKCVIPKGQPYYEEEKEEAETINATKQEIRDKINEKETT